MPHPSPADHGAHNGQPATDATSELLVNRVLADWWPGSSYVLFQRVQKVAQSDQLVIEVRKSES